MTDDLPVDIEGDETSGEEESWGLWEWLLAGGGVVAAIYVLAWVLDLLVWLTGYLLQAAIAVLVLYALYKGVVYLLGGESSSERETTIRDSQVEGELDDLSAGADLESEFGDLDSLESSETSDVTLGDLSEDDLDAGVEPSADLEDDELERKFAELEQEMSDE